MDEEKTVRNLVLSVCDLKSHGDVPCGRVGAQIVTVATRLYLHGGADENRAYGDLTVFEIEKQHWRELPVRGFRKPSPCYGHTLCVTPENDILLFGGLKSEDEDYPSDEDNVLSLDPPSFMVNSREGKSPHPRKWTHRGVPSNDLFVFQTDSSTWREPEVTGTPPRPRAFHSACVSQIPTSEGPTPILVVFGGATDAELQKGTDELFILNLMTWHWSSPTQLGCVPSARFGHKLCDLRGRNEILLFGGADDNGSIFSLHLSSNALNEVSWSRVEVENTPPLSRSFHTVDRINDRVYIFAGMTVSDVSDLYVLDIRNNRWTRPLYEGRVSLRAHSTAVLHDKLIVFGGCREAAGAAETDALGDSDKEKSVIAAIMSGSRAGDGEFRVSRRLFFLSVLEIKEGSSDLKFKLVTVGDSGVGKSCLLARFVQDLYSDFHVSTIGVDFKSVVAMVKGRLVTLQLWDTAGQERFSGVTGNYYRNADGFVLVYDATRRETFERIDRWIDQIREHHECGPQTLKLLIGNKHDLKNQIEVSESEARACASRIGAIYAATSAKTAANVDTAFLAAASHLADMRRKAAESGKTFSAAAPRAQISLGATEGRLASDGGETRCCGGGLWASSTSTPTTNRITTTTVDRNRIEGFGGTFVS